MSTLSKLYTQDMHLVGEVKEKWRFTKEFITIL